MVTDSGNTLNIDYDPILKKIVLKAHVIQNAWLGIGFNATSMVPNVNMVVFQGEGKLGVVTNRFSTGFKMPEVQERQDLAWTTSRSADGGYDFVVHRDATNDNP